MADTSLHISSGEGAPIVRASAAHLTYVDAWQASSFWARVGGVITVGCLIALVLAAPAVTIVSAIPVAALVPAGLVDVVERRLPNHMVVAAAGSMLLVICASLAGMNTALPDGWLGHLAVGAGLMAGPLLVMHLVSPASMGFGDVKIGVVLGASIGAIDPQLSLVALLIASGGTAVVGLSARQRQVAFGPGLILGTVIALAVGAMW